MTFNRREFLTFTFGALIMGGANSARAEEPAAFWADLRAGKAVALLRHAAAPGTGDPQGFRLDDCSTQRNLSEEGRAQSRAIGDLFRANGIAAAAVYSSQWCRCLDTARLLGLGEVTELALLNSFFDDTSRGTEQGAALLEWLRAQRLTGPAVFVTHQFNISGVTDRAPARGEMVIARITQAGPLEVLGSVPPPF